MVAEPLNTGMMTLKRGFMPGGRGAQRR
jgi:hypothetical protein